MTDREPVEVTQADREAAFGRYAERHGLHHELRRGSVCPWFDHWVRTGEFSTASANGAVESELTGDAQALAEHRVRATAETVERIAAWRDNAGAEPTRAQLRAQLAERRELGADASEVIAALSKDVRDLRAEREQLRDIVESTTEELQEFIDSAPGRIAELDALRADRDRLAAELQAQERTLDEARAAFRQEREWLADANVKNTRLSAELAEARAEVARLRAAATRLVASLRVYGRGDEIDADAIAKRDAMKEALGDE
jgi:DNA repair exonuclease SbcCD ATPase subunit